MNEFERWSIERLHLRERAAGQESGRRARAACARRCRRLAIAACATAGILWGAAFVFAKLALVELSVPHLILLRFIVATCALLPFVCARRIWPRRADLPRFIFTGFLLVPGTFLVEYEGLALTSAARAALIIGTLPPLLAVAGRWFYGERLSAQAWAAVACSTIGVALIVGWPGGAQSWLGDSLVFVSMFVVVAWVMLSKPLIARYTPLGATTYLLLFGTLTLVPFALVMDGAPHLPRSPLVAAAVVALALVCTSLTNLLWNWGLAHVQTARAGIYTNLEPLVGVLLGVAVLRESVGAGALAGGALIVASAVAVSRGRD